MRKITNAVFGTASEIDPEKLAAQIDPILIEGEEVVGAFKLVRDLIVFSNCRLILVDKQGMTGKKVEYHSIPYRKISHFAVESAGHLDMDSELKIWVSSSQTPVVKEFRKGTDVVAVQRLLAKHVLG